jgi:DNA-directed RNA polymerase specialized sigma24 family protein
VTLRYYYDVPIADIAATLGLSVNAVKMHLHRGLEALGTTLEAQR